MFRHVLYSTFINGIDDEAEFGRPWFNSAILRDDYCCNHQGARASGHNLPEPPSAPDPNGELRTKTEEDVLKVVNVDLKIAENAEAHHTDRYELTQILEEEMSTQPCLVVRRGEPFDFSITFDRPFDIQKDDLKLVFDFGKDPRESRGTRVVLLLSEEDEPRQWGAKILDQTDKTFTIRIFTPPDLPVTKWKFSFDTILKTDETSETFRFTHKQPIYILFNPWCSDDQVFMSDEASRDEYALNDSGRIFYGTKSQIGSMPWNFGQFEDFVLEVSLLLLDASGLNSSLRGNPVHVVRKISAMANSSDDNGVLVGKWSGDYSDGTEPTAWNGSVAILEQYWKTRRPVKYGQCWVFSAIVTTICRALGIPCRSVTNFVSAHDTDGSLTVDEYWDANGRPLEEYDTDSIWNFHVWNEVWMLRPDLPIGFGGWQVIDATPQETSEGVYCSGPASLEAIKNGHIHLPYDCPFIFAEVNADRVHCIQSSGRSWKYMIQADYIGNNISTKGPNSDERLDVTDQYKYPEGSNQERTVVWKAIASYSSKKKTYQPKAEDMQFEMVQRDDTNVGESFDVSLKIRNRSNANRTVSTTLSATMVRYTGVPITAIKSKSKTVSVSPNSETTVRMKVGVNDYLDKVTDMCHIKISSMSQVDETKQFHCDSDDFRLRKPPISIKVPSEVKLGEDCDVEASFTNPLQTALTKGTFSIEAPSLKRPVKLEYEDVAPNGVAKCSIKLTPQKVGEKEIIVGFWSKQLSGFSGSAKFKVTRSEDSTSG